MMQMVPMMPQTAGAGAMTYYPGYQQCSCAHKQKCDCRKRKKKKKKKKKETSESDTQAEYFYVRNPTQRYSGTRVEKTEVDLYRHHQGGGGGMSSNMIAPSHPQAMVQRKPPAAPVYDYNLALQQYYNATNQYRTQRMREAYSSAVDQYNRAVDQLNDYDEYGYDEYGDDPYVEYGTGTYDGYGQNYGEMGEYGYDEYGYDPYGPYDGY